MSAKLIVLEGIDGCGKSTTIDLLVKKLQNNYKAAGYKFPNYESPTGIMIKDVLYNRTNVIPNNLFKLYALNRHENRHLLQELLDNNDYVILDRYVLSNIIYSSVMANIPIQQIEDEFLEFEFDILKLPKWDQVYLLDISMEHLQKIIQERSKTGDQNDTNFELLLNLDTQYKNYFKANNYNIVPFTEANLRVELIYDSILSL